MAQVGNEYLATLVATSLAPSQLSKRKHRKRRALIRTDSGGGTHDSPYGADGQVGPGAWGDGFRRWMSGWSGGEHLMLAVAWRRMIVQQGTPVSTPR